MFLGPNALPSPTKSPKLTSSQILAAALKSAKKPSKYGNKKCKIGDESYRSQREAKRHQSLLYAERLGLIANLRREVPFVLALAVKINGRTKPALRYFADFVYDEKGAQVVEDAKGMRTAVYNIKRHLMATVHGVFILET